MTGVPRRTGRVALDIEAIRHVSDEEIEESGRTITVSSIQTISRWSVRPRLLTTSVTKLPLPPVAERVVFATMRATANRSVLSARSCIFVRLGADTLLTYGGQWFDLPVLDALWEDTSHAYPDETSAAMPWPSRRETTTMPISISLQYGHPVLFPRESSDQV